jgi:hypothetical protein
MLYVAAAAYCAANLKRKWWTMRVTIEFQGEPDEQSMYDAMAVLQSHVEATRDHARHRPLIWSVGRGVAWASRETRGGTVVLRQVLLGSEQEGEE